MVSRGCASLRARFGIAHLEHLARQRIDPYDGARLGELQRGDEFGK